MLWENTKILPIFSIASLAHFSAVATDVSLALVLFFKVFQRAGLDFSMASSTTFRTSSLNLRFLVYFKLTKVHLDTHSFKILIALLYSLTANEADTSMAFSRSNTSVGRGGAATAADTGAAFGASFWTGFAVGVALGAG